MKVYFVASNPHFVLPIMKELMATGEDCKIDTEFNPDNAHDADVIWCEWADANAIHVQRHITTAKKILRVHSYEVFTPLFKDIMFAEFDTVIFVSHGILAQAMEVANITNAIVISNYLPEIETKYRIPCGKERNNKVAYAGYITRKKGIGELVLIAESMPDYEFYVAGTLQDPDISTYLKCCVPKNLHIQSWTNDIASFYEDKTFVLNTSLRESFSVATVEGVLCGCAPLVRNWMGSEMLYPDRVYSSIQELAVLMSDDYNAEQYRSDTIDRLGLDRAMDIIYDILTTDTARPNKPPETLTIAIVQTREKYMPTLLNSLRLQKHGIQIDVLTNFDKDMSIGKAFNILADRCDTDWIMYLGDDDWLAEDYIDQVMDAYYKRRNQHPNIVGLLTGACLTDGDAINPTTNHPTGIWKADFVRNTRFNEDLVRQVDTEYIQRVGLNDGRYTIIKFDWIVGYFYRQHKSNISGNKYTEGAIKHQEVVK